MIFIYLNLNFNEEVPVTLNRWRRYQHNQMEIVLIQIAFKFWMGIYSIQVISFKFIYKKKTFFKF